MFLRWTRNALTAAAFLILLAITFEPNGVTAHEYHYLVDCQLVTAMMARAFFIVGVILIVTLLFGRVYCSILCPLGILQDIFSKLGKMTFRRRNHFHRGHSILRLFFFFVLGTATSYAIFFHRDNWLFWLNPFEIFENISVHCFTPIWNGIRGVFSFNPIPEKQLRFFDVMGGTLFAFLSLSVIGGLAFRYGRVFCHIVCPVGTLLSFLSRVSLFRIWIDRSECVSCGRCSALCKAHCIDLRHKKVELDRCIGCMDCLVNCPKDAIRYSPFCFHHEKSRTLELTNLVSNAASTSDPATPAPSDFSKRPDHQKDNLRHQEHHYRHTHHHSHRRSTPEDDSTPNHFKTGDILTGHFPQERQRMMLRQQARHRQKKIEALLPPEEREKLRKERENQQSHRRKHKILQERSLTSPPRGASHHHPKAADTNLPAPPEPEKRPQDENPSKT